MRYAVVIEKGERNYSAYAPDLPGCASVGDTVEEVKTEIRKATDFISMAAGGWLASPKAVESRGICRG